MKRNPKTVDLEARIRVASGVPADVVLSIVESKLGKLTVSAPSIGGPFLGDFESVKNQLTMAVKRHRL